MSRYIAVVPALAILLLSLGPAFGRTAGQGDEYLGIHTLRANGQMMSLARNAGSHWIVQLVSWREVETWKGRYFWEYPDSLVRAASFYDQNLVMRVDQQPAWSRSTAINGPPEDLNDYGDFLYALAARYRGKVKAYVVWNEPNLSVEWGGQPPDPEAYAEMLKLAYARIKEADPHALVVSAGLASTNENSSRAMDDRLYLLRLYQAGIKGSFDFLGAHPYGFAFAPDDPYGDHDGLNFRRLVDLREIMVANGDEDKHIWATEYGWTTAANNPEEKWKVVSEEQQAAYLQDGIILARREWPWLGLITVWNLSTGLPADDDLRGYSLVRDDLSPRPAYFALQSVQKAQGSAP